ncbi:Hypothetical Protein SLY_0483 [Strawberry lethal yellows phytoplasma (CPA) str. NZSb11]|uniref:Uncharacterized protein n=1 Tax=Strawberry lethal yellows phytoplasma (CPA) str. NZSb11 TaxID=980422 RepID=R4S0W4_PHYAS|nr:Hypothetical Protein SLY_0483 [Strawberry lethal yellows phytoplasma (CPA) str. NZSb11]
MNGLQIDHKTTNKTKVATKMKLSAIFSNVSIT